MSKVVTMNDIRTRPRNIIVTEEEQDTDTYYKNVIGQMKSIIVNQNDEISEKDRKTKILERAVEMKNNEAKKIIHQKDAELENERNRRIMVEEELDYHRQAEGNKSADRAETRKTVEELFSINAKRREKQISQAELDSEASEYLKKFKL